MRLVSTHRPFPQGRRLFCSDTRTSDDLRDPNYGYTTKPPTPDRAEEDVELLHRPIPHPYIYLGLSLMGAGYAPLVYRAEAGIDVESTHAIFRISTAYNNGHKVSDGNQPNPKGHDRYLETAAYYRMARGWFF